MLADAPPYDGARSKSGAVCTQAPRAYLGDKIIHAGIQAPLLVRLERIRSHGNNDVLMLVVSERACGRGAQVFFLHLADLFRGGDACTACMISMKDGISLEDTGVQ